MSESRSAVRPDAYGRDLVARWVHQICYASSSSATDIAEKLGFDPRTAEHLGSQRLFTSAAGLVARCELVVDRDGDTVLFVECQLRQPMPVSDLITVLGPGRELAMGPHDRAPSMAFDDVWPVAATRGCTVLVRLAGPPPSAAVASIVFYLQPARYDAP